MNTFIKRYRCGEAFCDIYQDALEIFNPRTGFVDAHLIGNFSAAGEADMSETPECTRTPRMAFPLARLFPGASGSAIITSIDWACHRVEFVAHGDPGIPERYLGDEEPVLKEPGQNE